VRSTLSVDQTDLKQLAENILQSEMFCADENLDERMKEIIKTAWQDGDSIGGIIEVLADGLPVGLGSYTQWDEKLDGQLAQALMSIQAMKAVEIGDGVESCGLPGSMVHDALYPTNGASNQVSIGGTTGVLTGVSADRPTNGPTGVSNDRRIGSANERRTDGPTGALPFYRKTNRAGGIEGGMTNGSRLRVRAYMKPIPTIRKGLPSVSFPDYAADTAHYERSDVCAVPAASVVAGAMAAFVLARALLLKPM
jgi:chorismate synthase